MEESAEALEAVLALALALEPVLEAEHVAELVVEREAMEALELEPVVPPLLLVRQLSRWEIKRREPTKQERREWETQRTTRLQASAR